MNSLVMWIGGILAALLAALFAVPSFVDWNVYRGVFEEEASRILGRDVRVGGKINVRLLPTPYLRFEKLRIADTQSQAVEPIFRTESFTLWLSVPPLLQGNLEARHLALESPVVTLAVNEAGTGNWTELGIRPGTLPFLPQKVALQAVDVTDGTIILRHPRSGEVGRLTGIAGQVSAESLTGPFKFAGDVSLAGQVREIRVASAKADADGTLRFKATARGKGEVSGGATYQLDGQFIGFSAQPQITGALTANVPLPHLPGTATQQVVQTPEAKAGPVAGAVSAEIKGQLTAKADRIEVSDIVASLENVGQPQLLTGTTTLEWGVSRRLDFAFASRWLDLDRLARAEGRASPIGTAAALIEGLVHVLPVQAATRGEITIDQLTLGGEALAKLDLAVSRVDVGGLRIERMQAALPAGGRLAASGMLLPREGGTDFEGQVTAAGPSLKRLLGWTLPNRASDEATPDQNFTIDGSLRVAADGVALRQARGTLGDHAIKGAVQLTRGAGMSVTLEAEAIESTWLWPGPMSRKTAFDWIEKVSADAVAWTGASAQATSSAGAAATSPRFDLKLRTGSLRGPEMNLRDVLVDVTAAAGTIGINRVAFRGGGGLEVDVTGQFADPRGVAKGALRGIVGAQDAKGLEMLLALLDVAGAERLGTLSQMTPLRLTGDVTVGQRSASAVDVSVDGAAAKGRFTLRGRLDGGLTPQWREAPVEITLAADEARATALLGFVLGERAVWGSAGRDEGADQIASVAIKAVGVPAEGLVADAALSRAGLSLSYNGRAVLDAQARPALSGTMEVAADRLGDVLALLGGAHGTPIDQPVTGTVGLSVDESGQVKVTPSGLTVAGAQVSGALSVGRAEGGRLRVDGGLAIDRASVGGLMTGLVAVAPRPTPASAADIAFQDALALWTDQPFAGEAFDRFEGGVSLKVAHLSMAPQVTLDDAALKVDLKPGVVDVALDGGQALGGKFTGKLALRRAAAGAEVDGWLGVEQAQLSALAQAAGSKRSSVGTIGGRLELAGRGLSPRSLISGLTGTGKLAFGEAKIEGLSPQTVAQTVTAGYAKEFEISAQTLDAEIRKWLGAGQLAIGNREIAVRVADGALQVDRFMIEGDAGHVEALATVDLQSMQAETEWRIVAASDIPDKPAWPPVSIYYTGALGTLSSIEPRVALGSFERELTVRRMEREVTELERMRQLDEERVRQQREQQKALEEERRRARAQGQLQAPKAAPQTPTPQELANPPVPNSAAGQSTAPPVAGQHAGTPTDPSWKAEATSPKLAPPAAADGASGSVEPAPSSAADAPTAGVPKPHRVAPRRSPAAGDTFLKSLNPSFN